MQILMPSDVFPPGSVGGAAWSAHTLARALIGAGHSVTAVVPARGRRGLARDEVGGVPVLRLGYRAPRLPFVQNYFRHEALWGPLAEAIAAAAGSGPRLIHAQHVQAAPAAVIAGRRLAAPVVVTVRDHWPWDYFATGLHGDRTPFPGTSLAGLLTDLPARLGPLRGAAAWAAIPYMLAHVRRRAAALARAEAVIAVSDYMAGRLAGLVEPGRLHVIPNMVELAAVEAAAAEAPATPLDGPFLLFVGKLEPNKGAGYLPDIFRAVPAPIRGLLPPLLVAGSGALRPALEANLAALGVSARFLGWVDHDESLRLLARCALLLFPSAWGEPLSRVPLEGAALGAVALAMPTGGTPDIIEDGVSGALAPTPAAFARRLLALLDDAPARARMAAAARARARARFAVEAVLPRVEALYRSLL